MEFENFYELTSDIYQDDLDMAYDHYTELIVEGDADMYSEEDLFEDFLETYGDNFEDLDEAADAFVELYSDELYNEDEEFDFDDEDEDFDFEDEDFDFEDDDDYSYYDDFVTEEMEEIYSDVMGDFYAAYDFEDFDNIEDYLYAEAEAEKVATEAATSGAEAGRNAGRKIGKFIRPVGDGVIGAGLGYGVNHLLTRKTRARVKELQSRSNLTTAEAQELATLKRKLRNRKLIAAGAGATIGVASGWKGSNSAQDTNNSYYGEFDEEFYDDEYADLKLDRWSTIKQNAPSVGKGIASIHTGVGAAAGLGTSIYRNRQLKARIKELKAKTRLSQAEAEELARLKKSYRNNLMKGTAVGAGAGYIARNIQKGLGAEKVYREAKEDKKSDLYAFLDMDDYMDEVENYSENVDSTVSGEKKTGFLKKYKNTAIGGAVGGALGGVAGALTSKDKETRRRLKARIKAGVASQAEIDRYKQLVGDRTKRILIGTGAGMVTGAGGTSLFNKFTKKAEADLNDSKNTAAPKKAAADVDVSKDTNNSYYGDIDSDVEDRVYSATVKASQSHETIAKLLTSK